MVMKPIVASAAFALVGLTLAGCTPPWAKTNSSPYIMEISGIAGSSGVGSTLRSDVLTDGSVFNDDAVVSVNIFRKNNNPGLGVSPVEHIYLERYEVRYFRTDGHSVEGVDVPYGISGPLGNIRYHTPSSGGGGEVEASLTITIVRHDAKREAPLRALRSPNLTVLTTIAQITVHGRTVQGDALVATGQVEVQFADFADQ
jgi:hypothetical protein